MKTAARKIGKGILQSVIAAVLIAGIGYSILAFTNDLAHSQPVEGIRVFLADKDICSIALGDGFLWAGGSDGLFKLTWTAPKDASSQAGAEYTIESFEGYQYIKAVLLDGGETMGWSRQRADPDPKRHGDKFHEDARIAGPACERPLS